MTPESVALAVLCVLIAVGFMALAVEQARLTRYVLATLSGIVAVTFTFLTVMSLVTL
jgi:hypothetical protein